MPQLMRNLVGNTRFHRGIAMRARAAFALISLTVACWTASAAAEEPAKGATDKPKVMATSPRQVDTTHKIGVLSTGGGLATAGNVRSATVDATAAATVAA